MRKNHVAIKPLWRALGRVPMVFRGQSASIWVTGICAASGLAGWDQTNTFRENNINAHLKGNALSSISRPSSNKQK